MPIWTFVDYVEASGRSPFADWLVGNIPPDAKAAIDTRFLQMAAMERWPDKWVSSYEGYPGILEQGFLSIGCSIDRCSCTILRYGDRLSCSMVQ